MILKQVDNLLSKKPGAHKLNYCKFIYVAINTQ